MALDDLPGMDIDDNRGGRPRSEEDVTKDPVNDFPYTQQKNPHEQVKRLANYQILGDIEDNIPKLSEYLAVNPVQVRILLEEVDELETNWEQYIENNPVYENDSRIPINEEPSSSSGTLRSWKDAGDEKTFADTADDSTMDSGLSAMLDKEK